MEWEHVHRAAMRGDLPRLQHYISVNPTLVNIQDPPTLSTPLIIASRCGRVDVVVFLLDHGADISHRNRRGWSALFRACACAQTKVISVLLDRGAKMWTTNNAGSTPFLAAARLGKVEVLDLLLRRSKADGQWLVPESEKQRALEFACRDGNWSVVGVLLRAGADPCLRYMDGRLPVEIAAEAGHVACAEVLKASMVRYYVRRARAIHDAAHAVQHHTPVREQILARKDGNDNARTTTMSVDGAAAAEHAHAPRDAHAAILANGVTEACSVSTNHGATHVSLHAALQRRVLRGDALPVVVCGYDDTQLKSPAAACVVWGLNVNILEEETERMAYMSRGRGACGSGHGIGGGDVGVGGEKRGLGRSNAVRQCLARDGYGAVGSGGYGGGGTGEDEDGDGGYSRSVRRQCLVHVVTQLAPDIYREAMELLGWHE